MPDFSNADRLRPRESYASELEAPGPAALSAFDAAPEPPDYPLVTEPVTLHLVFPVSGGGMNPGTEALLEAFTAETGVTLAPHPMPLDDYLSDINTLMAGGDAMDLIACAPEYMLDTERMDVLTPLEDLIAAHAPNYIQAATACYDGLQALVEEDGHIMRLYRFYDAPQLTPDLGAAIRQDWLEALGLDPPETYEDYHQLLLAMKYRYGCKLPFRMLPAGITDADCFTAGFGVSVGSRTAANGFYQVDGTVKYGLLEDGFEDYVATMRQWYEEGLITPAYRDFVDLASNSYLIDLSVGDSGVFFLPLGSFDLLSDMGGFPLLAGMDPVREPGDSTHLAPGRATSIAGTGLSITAACEDQALAMEAADWFYSDTANMAGNYGREGVTYTMEQGTPTYTELTRSDLPRFTAYLQGIHTGERRSLLLADYGPVLEGWTRQKDTAYMLPDLYFGVKTRDSYEALMLDLGTYADGCVAQLISGEMPLSELPAVRQRLHELRVDEALALWQQALDRYP